MTLHTSAMVFPSAGLFSLVQTTPFPDNFRLLFVIWLLPSQSVGCYHRPSKSLGCPLSPDVNSGRQDWGLIYLSICSICIMFGIFVGIQKWTWMNEQRITLFILSKTKENWTNHHVIPVKKSQSGSRLLLGLLFIMICWIYTSSWPKEQ